MNRECQLVIGWCLVVGGIVFLVTTLFWADQLEESRSHTHRLIKAIDVLLVATKQCANSGEPKQ